MIQQSLEELYSSKSDEELLALAADSPSLTADAKSILAQELQRRNLQPPSYEDTHTRPASAPRALVFAVALILNICIALFGTPLLEAGIGKMFHPHSLAAVLLKWWILDLLCAAGLGFSISRLWRTNAAAWTWVLPALWFILRFVPVALSGDNQTVMVSRSVWSQFSGCECISGLKSLGCRNFFLFTLPFVRGVSYAAGAHLSKMVTYQPKRIPEADAGAARLPNPAD